MTFYERLDAVVELLRRRQRVSYRALKREFGLDDALVSDLAAELIEVQRVARDENGAVLVWIGSEESTAAPAASPSTPAAVPSAAPTAAPEPTPAPGDAERRQVTVMFCDLVRSTELASRLDPEELRDLLRAYQEAADEVVRRFGGVIARYVGDGLLIYFGYPQAHEDDAGRAVRAGLGIVEAVRALHARLSPGLAPLRALPLQVRVGLHTGVAVMGTMGDLAHRDDMAAVGETPNLAARIQGLADADTVLLSAATHRLLRGTFSCAPLGPQSLRGIAAPMAVYRALGEAQAEETAESLAAQRSPLVGRDEEVGLLLDRWARVKEGFGQIVLVSGEAGIGKSRLVQVLKTHAAGEPHIVVETRCSPFHQNSALYPIAELLHQVVGVRRDQPSGESLDRLERALGASGIPASRSIPALAPLLGLSLPEGRFPTRQLAPDRQRQETLETLVALIVGLAAHRPVLLIVEDLHWVDPSTLECLGLLIEQAPTERLLVLLTARPDFRAPWATRGHLTPLALGRFRRAQIEALIGSVAGGKALPDAVLEQVATKTDGVPLFIEELTKMVLESGLLHEEDDHYRLVGSLPPLAIPATLQDSLMARLDRLATVKAVAQVCATIGRTAAHGLIRAVAGLDEVMLERALGELVEAELLYQRGAGPRAVYTFKHALIQEAAYQTMLKSTRQRHHERIARALESDFAEVAEAQPELLAHHYTEAGLVGEAIPHWRRAGQHALARFANPEAASHFSRCLDLLQALPESPDRARQELALQLTQAGALMIARSWGAPEVGRAYARACDLARELGEVRQLERALSGLATSCWTRGELKTARAIAEECLAVAGRIGEPASLVRAHVTLGHSMLWRGEFTEARVHLEHAVAGHVAAPPRARMSAHDPEVMARAGRAAALCLLGFPDQALAAVGEAMKVAEGLANPFPMAVALYFSSMIHQFRREGAATRTCAEALERLSAERGFGWWGVSGAIWRAWVRADGCPDRDAVDEIRRGLQTERASGTELSQPHGLALLADTCLKAGLIDEGLETVDEALETIQRSDERMCEAEIHRLRGELLMRRDRYAEAEDSFHQAIGVAQKQQARLLELRAVTSLLRLGRRTGGGDDARDRLGEICDWFSEGFDTTDLREARILRAA